MASCIASKPLQLKFMHAVIVFWIAALFIAYVYLGYPLLLMVLNLFLRRQHRRQTYEAKVTLLVAAYNEAAVIASKVHNALALDYPPDRLEILIASDGSSDATDQIVRGIITSGLGDRVQLLEFAHRGKIATLNEAVRHASGDILVFSDASSMLARDSIRELISNFADPRIGAASGVYRVLNREQSQLGCQEDFYWRYETFLKLQEAKLGCVLGAHGSMFAVRRELYSFPAPHIINDDFIIPLRVLRRGFRIAYEPRAIAYEEAHEMEGFGRRVRIARGNVEQLTELWGLLWPPRPLVLLCFLSHKLGRLVVPLAMVVLAISNGWLRHTPLYAALAAAQAGFYVLALSGGLMPLRPKVLRLPFYFCMINAALFAWPYYLLRSRPGAHQQGVLWSG